jgi:hypothetical protein
VSRVVHLRTLLDKHGPTVRYVNEDFNINYLRIIPAITKKTPLSSVLLEKLIVAQLLNKISTI